MQVMTQTAVAKRGGLTSAMGAVADSEFLTPETVRSGVAAGTIVIPANVNHKKIAPIGIGNPLRVKINANIGKSHVSSCLSGEVDKLRTALRYGADTVMDLSTGDNLGDIRRAILDECSAPLGTVPIYEIVSRVENAEDFSHELMLAVIKEQAEQGVDYMTIHAGLLREHLPAALRRRLGIVSRGGAIIAKWMTEHKAQNPFYERFDDILRICSEHDVTLSLGDGLRPGCLADASDEAQFAELAALGGLVRRCRAADVQVMVEGPGHVPFDQIEMNMRKERELCDGAPFYVLGPVVADCAPGYDHISSAIGATMAAFHGAAMLCYVTPKEHLGLPNAEDVRQGVVAYKIAAHAADVALKRPRARDRDDAISAARADFDWERQFELALDPERAREFRKTAEASEMAPQRQEGVGSAHGDGRYCTMCGPKFCSMRLSQSVAKGIASSGV